MVIRRALAEDSRGIAEVHVASWKHAYRGIVPQPHLDELSVADREKRWAEIVDQKDCEIFVADAEGQIVGFISFRQIATGASRAR